MKYKEELLYWLEHQEDDDDEAFIAWLQSKPLLDQPEILRELKLLVEKNLIERGELQNNITLFEGYNDTVDNYEDKILDEKLAKAQLDMAIEDRDKQMQEMHDSVDGIREYIKECIEANAPNAPQMRELSNHVIHYQKEAGLYKAKDWDFLL